MRNAWMKLLMNSNIPQNVLKKFGYKRRKNRSMTYSLFGIAASAAAAYALRNRMGGMRRFFQNTNIAGGMKSAFQQASAANLAEFAKELSPGINSKNQDTQGEKGQATNDLDFAGSKFMKQTTESLVGTEGTKN